MKMFLYQKKYIRVSVTNGFQVGSNVGTQAHYNTTAFQFGEDLSMVRGNHQIGFGGRLDSSANEREGHGLFQHLEHLQRDDLQIMGWRTFCSVSHRQSARHPGNFPLSVGFRRRLPAGLVESNAATNDQSGNPVGALPSGLH